jgi:Cys-tRNA(Pro)/Cys-tRNA(Cys) deacylase
MSSKTRAIQALERAGVAFEIHSYQVDSAEGSYGEAVAAALGVSGDRVLKTLVASVDGRPTIGIVPVERQLSLKALARAANGKRAQMVDGKDAERLTGYVVGGISPFGRTRVLPVFVDESAFGNATVYVSGGQRGIQLEIDPEVFIPLIDATRASIAE